MTLHFIYNANSGKLNALLDAGHKLLSPSTYKCHLCALTFDTFTENNLWKTFREASAINMQFFHIDEFEKIYPDTKYNYPIVLLQYNNEINKFIDSEELKSVKTVENLIDEILKRVQDDTSRVT